MMFVGVHLPLSLYGADGAADIARNVLAMVVSGIGMRLLIGAFDTWGHRSILALGLIHATFNASSELVDADSDWVRYVVTLILGLGAAAIFLTTGGRTAMTSEVLRYAAFSTGTDAPAGGAGGAPGGNPAGVVLDAECLTDSQMLAIAQAIGYSETAFVVPTGNAEARVRFFSPVAEVAFCGHATVATAVAYAERHGPGPLRLTTAAGVVDVSTRVEGGDLVATLTSPPTTTHPVEDDIVDEALAALRWTRDRSIPVSRCTSPSQATSTSCSPYALGKPWRSSTTTIRRSMR